MDSKSPQPGGEALSKTSGKQTFDLIDFVRRRSELKQIELCRSERSPQYWKYVFYEQCGAVPLQYKTLIGVLRQPGCVHA